MIVRPRPTAFNLWFILRGSIVPTILPHLLVVVAFSFGVAILHRLFPNLLHDATPAPFTLFGVALSIFLGFRNNACYERWWEGRRQWGQLIAEVRNLVREILVLLPDEPALRRRCAHRVVAFAHALRGLLRGVDAPEARAWLSDEDFHHISAGTNLPDAIQRAQAETFAVLLREGALSDMLYRVLSERLRAMTDIQTACERLRPTPTPFTYTLLLHRTAWLFCLLLPFGLVSSLGLATPIVTAIMAYAFFGLDALGDELEAPFSRSQNALPLDAMVRAIEIAVAEALEEANVPQPVAPKDYVLL